MQALFHVDVSRNSSEHEFSRGLSCWTSEASLAPNRESNAERTFGSGAASPFDALFSDWLAGHGGLGRNHFV
jgi:hypothetical protein